MPVGGCDTSFRAIREAHVRSPTTTDMAEFDADASLPEREVRPNVLVHSDQGPLSARGGSQAGLKALVVATVLLLQEHRPLSHQGALAFSSTRATPWPDPTQTPSTP